jgi:hypothetical protein
MMQQLPLVGHSMSEASLDNNGHHHHHHHHHHHQLLISNLFYPDGVDSLDEEHEKVGQRAINMGGTQTRRSSSSSPSPPSSSTGSAAAAVRRGRNEMGGVGSASFAQSLELVGLDANGMDLTEDDLSADLSLQMPVLTGHPHSLNILRHLHQGLTEEVEEEEEYHIPPPPPMPDLMLPPFIQEEVSGVKRSRMDTDEDELNHPKRMKLV